MRPGKIYNLHKRENPNRVFEERNKERQKITIRLQKCRRYYTEEDVSLVVSEDQEDDVDEPGEKQTSDTEEPGADKQTSDSEEPCAVGDEEGDSASDSEEYGAEASYFHFSDEETPRPSSSRVNIFQMKNFARKVRTPGTQDGGA